MIAIVHARIAMYDCDRITGGSLGTVEVSPVTGSDRADLRIAIRSYLLEELAIRVPADPARALLRDPLASSDPLPGVAQERSWRDAVPRTGEGALRVGLTEELSRDAVTIEIALGSHRRVATVIRSELEVALDGY